MWLVSLGACGASAQLVLKGPIEQQCSSVGLQACPELTEGVLLYVEGDHPSAMRKIHVGTSKNEPAQLHAFAEKIRALKNFPGADDYVAPLIEVATFLAPEEGKSAGTVQDADGDETPASRSPRAQSASLRSPSVREYFAASAVPATDQRARVCQLYVNASWESDAVIARCITAGTGPLVLMDVQTTGACRDVLAIGAGDPASPHWVLVGEPSAALSAHGAHLPVAAGDSLFVAQGGMRALDHGAACLLTWVTER